MPKKPASTKKMIATSAIPQVTNPMPMTKGKQPTPTMGNPTSDKGKNVALLLKLVGKKAVPAKGKVKAKKTASTQKMMATEKAIEKKTAGKPKTAAEKKLEQKISKQTGKAYKGKK